MAVSKNSKNVHKHNDSIALMVLVIILFIVFFIIYFTSGIRNQPTQRSFAADVVPHEATLLGMYLCLPHTDTKGPQTEECAAGIRTDDGAYYAIDFQAISKGIPPLSNGAQIQISGLLTPIEMLSTNYWKRYPIQGILTASDSLIFL
jgi:hypothetical protein